MIVLRDERSGRCPIMWKSVIRKRIWKSIIKAGGSNGDGCISQRNMEGVVKEMVGIVGNTDSKSIMKTIVLMMGVTEGWW